MKKNLALALAVGLLTTLNSASAAEARSAPLKPDFANVSPVELPMKAAAAVKAAKAPERPVVTVDVVKVCLSIKPTIAPSLVAAIAKAVPEMAGLAAEAATREQPKMAVEIAKAAAAAAPKNLEAIVAAVCRAAPAEYKNISLAVAQVAPNAQVEILKGVAAAIPEMKGSIETALANSVESTPAVASVLQGSSNPTASAPARGPTIKPPYLPLSTTPANINPTETYPAPPGGRNYASP